MLAHAGGRLSPPTNARYFSRVKFSFITLGCDKNTVDSERYLAQLTDRGAEFAADAAQADVIVINTCGFIDAAKKESIDAIVEAGRLKTEGNARAVVAVGCMVAAAQGRTRRRTPGSGPVSSALRKWIGSFPNSKRAG